MQVIYARQPLPATKPGEILPNSIFLVGPTPRDKNVPSWRPKALELLKSKGFDGTVFAPEDADLQGMGEAFDYKTQIWWEIEALGKAACVCCWVPRDLGDMPAFTTNVEFGFCLANKPQRLVLGAPPDAPKMKYLKELGRNNQRFQQAFGRADTLPSIPVVERLEEALDKALQIAKT